MVEEKEKMTILEAQRRADLHAEQAEWYLKGAGGIGGSERQAYVMAHAALATMYATIARDERRLRGA